MIICTIQEPIVYSHLFPPSRRRRSNAGKSRPGKRKKPPSGSGTPERQSKRRRLEEQMDEGPPDVVNACRMGRVLTENELQSAKYINEMMSHGVRDYATGWLLQDTTMTLWYADRMGLVQSAPFDIFGEPHLLLLLVAALARAGHPIVAVPWITSPGHSLPLRAVCAGEDAQVTQHGPGAGCGQQTRAWRDRARRARSGGMQGKPEEKENPRCPLRYGNVIGGKRRR